MGDLVAGGITVFSMQSLTPNAATVLDRARMAGAVFTAEDARAVAHVARSVPAVTPADARTIRQSIGVLAAAMPAKASDEVEGKLKLDAYKRMLEGCDERALAYACRRCMRELDWFPTVKQLLDRMADFVSDEVMAIKRAKFIVRSVAEAAAKAAEPAPRPVTIDDYRAMRRTAMGPDLLKMALGCGAIDQETYDLLMSEQPSEEKANVDQD